MRVIVAFAFLLSISLVGCISEEKREENHAAPAPALGSGLESIGEVEVYVNVLDTHDEIYVSESEIKVLAEESLRRGSTGQSEEGDDKATLHITVIPFRTSSAIELDLEREVKYKVGGGRVYSLDASTWSYSSWVAGPIDSDDVKREVNSSVSYFRNELRKANK